MTNGLLVLSSDLHVIYCSDHVAGLLELRPNQILGQGLEEVLRRRAHSDETGEFVDTLTGIINDPLGEPLTAEITLSRPRPVELAVAAFPIVLGPGEKIVVLLVDAVTSERQAARQWDTAIAILAHELYNPLTVITAYSDVTLNETTLNPIQRVMV